MSIIEQKGGLNMTKGLHKNSLRKVDNPHQWMIDDARMELIQQIKAEVERLKKEQPARNAIGAICGVETVVDASKLLSLLDTLQEQPVKTNIVEDLKHYLATTPKEEVERKWEELKEWNKVGPSVSEFLGWEQPVDLEKEVLKWMRDNCDINGFFNQIELARHFYELGRQSKKRELLPMIDCICASCPEKVKAESALNKFISENCSHCSIEHCPGVKACYTSSNKQLQ